MTRSLGGRLLVTLSVLLVLFFGATMIALDNAYERALERAARDQLDTLLLALIANAQPGPQIAGQPDARGAFMLPTRALDPRLEQPSSGVFALVADAEGAVVWRSRSAVGWTLTAPKAPPLGERRFRDDLTVGDAPVFALSLAVEWEDGHQFRFTVAEDQHAAREQQARFRTQLLGWFALISLLFLIAQAVLLRWILRPLRKVAEDVQAIQAGRTAQLVGDYPAELDALVAGLNALVRNERLRLERYRNSLGDLAHSLKTPLAIVRRALEEGDAGAHGSIGEQIARVDEIVEYQLQRAAAAGGTTFGAAVAVRATADKVVASLRKVHADRGLTLETFIDPAARFHGDAGDLIELLGNLVDNACKHARSRVVVGAVPLSGGPRARPGLKIVVGDDGAGFPPERIAALGQRGVRGDSATPGHGIGLAIVQDLAALHGGSVTLGQSDLGGAEVTVLLPTV